MWGRNVIDCIHGKFGCDPAYCPGRGYRPSWPQLRENGRDTVTGRRFSGNSSAEMDELETTAEPLPSHRNVVGEGGKKPNMETPHQ